jgi:hypothetical protein
MEDYIKRCTVLINTAIVFYSRRGNDEYYYPESMTKDLQKWISSTCNIISLISPQQSYFYTESTKLASDKDFRHTVPFHVIERLTGLLESLRDEMQSGLLQGLEYKFTASAFDEFLDHADSLHKGGKKIEASILASIVFEDTIRKIAKKNSRDDKGKDLESIIDDLVKVDVLPPVKAKKAKSFGAIRNKALHADWDAFDIRDVGDIIKGTREFIENYL